MDVVVTWDIPIYLTVTATTRCKSLLSINVLSNCPTSIDVFSTELSQSFVKRCHCSVNVLTWDV
jgi:hypothetical protein